MDKDIFLINTKELNSNEGQIPFYKTIRANVIEEYHSADSMEYLDIAIPFYQCHRNMPDIEEMKKIVALVSETKPYYIVNIGGNSFLSDILSRMIPVMTISTVFSSLAITEGQFNIIGRKLEKEDINFLHAFGFSEENVIESVFTSSFKPQVNTYTKKDLGLPDKFIIAVVGARLNEELTEEFLSMLNNSLFDKAHVAILGKFDLCEKYTKQIQNFNLNFTNLGFVDDALAVLENCDLYVNPKRSGGGTSAVEAMYKGLPVITLPYGDVAVNTGRDFFADDYMDMGLKIKKYIYDKKFYAQMSEKAIERAKTRLETDSEFQKIIDKALNNRLFF